jgi:hypothetical protein
MLFRQRMADMETLGRITPKVIQHIPGRIAFNALGNDLVAEVVSQIDDRAHDGDILIVECDIDDERLVNL